MSTVTQIRNSQSAICNSQFPGGNAPPLPAELGATRPMHRACPVCQSSDGANLGRLNFAQLEGTELPDCYNVVCCGTCGFVRCDAADGQATYDRFYKGFRYSPAYLARATTPDERRYFDAILAAIRQYLTDPLSPIVDVGCGCGSFIRHCRLRDLKELRAVDLSSACIEKLRQEGFRAEVGSVADMPPEPAGPGAIILSHVLEHVVDLESALRSVRRRLAEGGIVYVEVPDTEFFATFNQDAPLRFFYPQHVVHFDETHLDNLFRVHGLKKVECRRCRRCEGELTIPAIAAVFVADEPPVKPVTPDFRLARLIQEWFDEENLDPPGAFAELARRGDQVYVWGIGIHVQMLLGMSPLRDCNIVCCVDQDAELQGRTIAGRVIASPAALRKATGRDTVLIGSLIHRRRMVETLRNEWGFTGNIITV